LLREISWEYGKMEATQGHLRESVSVKRVTMLFKNTEAMSMREC
jgi:hypothetical protein